MQSGWWSFNSFFANFVQSYLRFGCVCTGHLWLSDQFWQSWKLNIKYIRHQIIKLWVSLVTNLLFNACVQLEHGVRPHSKYLMEYFAFLYDFAKMGDTECMFLIHINSISSMVNFYMGQKAQEHYVSCGISTFSLSYLYLGMWVMNSSITFLMLYISDSLMSPKTLHKFNDTDERCCKTVL